MTKEEIKNYVIEHKECCKKLAEEYRQRYNEDNTDKLALNMFYHNVISYNDFETILATIEDRNSMIMCFSKPPILSEKTVEVELNRIEELEKDKQYFSDSLDKQIEATLKLQQENAELSEKLNRHKHDCPNCSAFGKHCPHRVNGDPYTYDCYLTVAELEKENIELKKMYHESDEDNNKLRENIPLLAEAKEIIKKLQFLYLSPVVTKDDVKRQDEILAEVKQFLKDSEVEK